MLMLWILPRTDFWFTALPDIHLPHLLKLLLISMVKALERYKPRMITVFN